MEDGYGYDSDQDMDLGLQGNLPPAPPPPVNIGRNAAISSTLNNPAPQEPESYAPFSLDPRNESEEESKSDDKPIHSQSKKVFDFRFGKIPDGVQIIAGNGSEQADLEIQTDQSTSLVIPPQAHLNLELDWKESAPYLNDYTIVMDVRVDSLPLDCLSLYQANDARPTEGECFVSNHGGVGIFGEYGVKKAEIKPGKWHRIVIAFGTDKGSIRRMNTYVNGEPCATIQKGVFDIPDSRFALSADLLSLFKSSRPEFQPGIRVRYVEVQIGAASRERIKQFINENRIFSYWEVQREQDEQMRFQGLSLQSLYKRPPPIWLHPMFLGMFGDCHLGGTNLDTGSSLHPCIAVMDLILQRILSTQQDTLSTFSHENIQSVTSLQSILSDGSTVARSSSLMLAGILHK